MLWLQVCATMSNLRDLLLFFFKWLRVVGDHKFRNPVRSVCITLTGLNLWLVQADLELWNPPPLPFKCWGSRWYTPPCSAETVILTHTSPCPGLPIHIIYILSDCITFFLERTNPFSSFEDLPTGTLFGVLFEMQYNDDFSVWFQNK